MQHEGDDQGDLLGADLSGRAIGYTYCISNYGIRVT